MRTPKPRTTPEQVAAIVDMLPTALSLREIAEKLSMSVPTVAVHARPIIQILRFTGGLEPCACGKERFHMYGCTGSRRPEIDARKNPKCTPVMLAKRAAVIDLIMTGEMYKDIERKLGMRPDTARKYLKHMTPEQVAKRQALQAQRARAHTPVVSPRPFRDALYARIASAIPRWLSDATREDVISEIYLAVLDGTLDAEAIEANAKRFAQAGVTAYESKFGPRSLDDRQFEDSTRTLVESIPDPSALAAFNYIFEEISS